MKKQRFFRSVTLGIVMLMLLSSIVRAQQGNTPCGNFTYPSIGEVTEVTFEGINRIEIHHDYAPHDPFSTPHWKKGRTEQSPVAYVAGNNASLIAQFKINCIPKNGTSAEVFAKGVGPNGIIFPAKKLTITGGGDIGMYIESANNSFTAGTVDYFAPFEIQWQLSKSLNGTFEDAGKSQNTL